MVKCMLVLAAAICAAQAALPPVPADYPGQGCVLSNIKPVENFDVSRFLGTWYEDSWLPPYYFPKSLVLYDFSETYARIEGSQNLMKTLYGIADYSTKACMGFSIPIIYNGPGKFIVHYPDKDSVFHPIDYWVVDTDYDNYMVSYGCTAQSNGICQAGHLFVYSRAQKLAEYHKNIVSGLMEKYCIKYGDLIHNSRATVCIP